MTSRTWGNRCNPSSAGSRGEVGRGVKGARRAFISTLDAPPDLFIIERRNEAERSTVELRSLAVGFCGCIKGSPDFMKSKGRPSILRQRRAVVGQRSEPLAARTVLKSSCKRERRVASWTAKVDHFFPLKARMRESRSSRDSPVALTAGPDTAAGGTSSAPRALLPLRRLGLLPECPFLRGFMGVSAA
jgi:hypothetical protein